MEIVPDDYRFTFIQYRSRPIVSGRSLNGIRRFILAIMALDRHHCDIGGYDRTRCRSGFRTYVLG